MKRYGQKKKYRKRLLPLLLAAALILQSAVPVQAAVPQEGGASGNLSETGSLLDETAESEALADDTVENEIVTDETSTDETVEEKTEGTTADETVTEGSTGEEVSTKESEEEESKTEVSDKTGQETTEPDSDEGAIDEDASEGDSVETVAESTNAEGGNVLKNGSFETTKSTTDKKWTGGIMPDGYNNLWASKDADKGQEKMVFAVENDAEAKDGQKVLHISSTDKVERWDLAQPGMAIDPNKNYKCSFWVKAENVTGTGLYLMMKRKLKDAGTKETVSSAKITGTTNGWVQYEFTSNFPAENENGKTESIQLDMYAEYMTGDVWIDDIRVIPIEELSISQTTLTLAPGKTHELTVTGAGEAEIIWASDNEEVATVDNNGLVTAVADGQAKITAAVNGEVLECIVTVATKEGMVPDEKAVWWDDIETSSVSTETNLIKYWENAEVPTGWTTGFNTAKKAKFKLVQDDTHTGNQAIYGKSDAVETYTSPSIKVSIYNILKDNEGKKIVFDYHKNYLLRAWVKTKDLTLAAASTWKGLIFRAGVGNNRIVEDIQILGTNDWQCYELELSSEKIQAALTKGGETNKDTGNIQVEFVFEQVKGEVWIDTLELVEDYRLSFENKELMLDKGKTHQLTVKGGIPQGASITWSSSDENVVTVEDGLVTAVESGQAVVTAFIDEEHQVSCDVKVVDPGMYAVMREKWTNRLTGNHKWNGGSPSEDYQKILENYKEAAKTAWDLYKNDTNHDDGIFGLTLNKSLFGTSTSTDAADSTPFYTVFKYIQDMAVAYSAEGTGSEYYQNAELKAAILEALVWAYTNIYNENLKNDAMFGNWYHWWISIPQSLAGTVILMHDDLEADKPELLDNLGKALAHFNDDPAWVYKVLGAKGQMEMTFANLADTSLASLLRGVACDDPDAIDNGVKYVGNILKTVSSGDGIYADGSLIQHTNLAYTAGYCATALNKLENIFYLSDSTDWAVSEENSAPVWTWIWEGIRPLYADGAIFDMVNGRGMSRPTSSDLKNGRGMMESMAMLVKFAPDQWRARLQSFVKAQLIAGIKGMGGEDTYFEGRNADAVSALKELLNDESIVPVERELYAKVFGSMDKAVAHSAKFSFGLSYSSARTGRFEFGNGENAKGWHQSDGAVYMYNGDPNQYSVNYWNTVDNHRLAGITTDHSEWAIKAWGDYKGNANFNGGSAVGPYASIVMNFKNYSTADNPNLAARKAWFVFDNEVVALGSGITGINTSRTTETIVDNKKINGTNKLIIDGTEQDTTIDNQKKSIANVNWAWMEGNTEKDSMGYYFPEGSKLDVLRESRTGNWTDINTSVSDTSDVTCNYLSLAVPHGENAGNKLESFKKENYNYVLLPSMSSEEVKAYAENPDIQVLSNSTFVQAVADHKANAAGYIFWGDTTTPIHIGEVEATVGSITIVKDPQTHTMRVGMADVHQNKSSLTFRVYGNNLSMAEGNEKVTAKFDKYGAELTVNTAGAQGATIEVTLNYEDMPEEQLNELATMREKYSNSLTGNDLPAQSKADSEYKAYMEKYEKAAEAALAQINMDAGKGTKLFNDIELLDWANKGSANTDGSATLTTTTTRIKDIVVAYKSDGTKYYNNPEAKAAIDVCMEYLMSGFPNILNYHDRVFGNWWDWSIGVPKDLTVIGILLYDDLSEEYRNELHNMIQLLVPDVDYYWGRSSSGRASRVAATGANGTEMAMNVVLNGLIGNDPTSLFKASDSMISELRYADYGKEGFYPDGSYRQHGNFAYTGAYGVEKLRGVTTLATVLYNTTWAPEGVDTDIVYEWILNSYRPVYADGGIFDMVQGRSISRYNRSDITTGRYAMDAIVRLAADAPEQYRDKINSFAKTQAAMGVAYDAKSYYGGMKSLSSLMIVRNLLSDDSIPYDTENYTRIYGSMDKAVTHGYGYALGFSMFSRRMGAVESINNENLKGWYTSDGATTLYNGDLGQFGEGYWATVDHTRLAGITTNHVTKSMTSNNIKTNDRDWVGGSALDTENYASVGMDFKSTISDLEAKKSWFVFGNQIVALGAGITTTAGDYTETIVENRKIDGNNRLLVNGTEAVAANGKEEVKANWAWLSKNAKGTDIGYYFPEETEVTLVRETRTGKWSEVNTNIKAGDADEVTKDYISIAMQHGVNPAGADYSYVLLPGKTSKQMERYASKNGIVILSNTSQLQAAADTVLKVSGYNFWEAGESAVPEQNGITKLTSDAPVSVTMFNDGNKNIRLAISDPTQKSSTITLRLEGAGLSKISCDDGVTMNADETGMTITVVVSGKLGATMNATLSSQNAEIGSDTGKEVTVTWHYPDKDPEEEIVEVPYKLSDPELEGEDEAGKYIVKWYTDANHIIPYDFSKEILKDTDLYGSYHYLNNVTVTWHYPDGRTEQEEVSICTKLPKPGLEGENETGKYTIKWYTDEAKTIPYDFDTEVLEDMDLYGDYDYYVLNKKVTLYYPDGSVETKILKPDTQLTKPVFEEEDANGKYGILWYADEEMTVLYDFDSAVTEDISLYGVYYYYYEETDKDDEGNEETIKTGIQVARINDEEYTGKAIKPAVVVYDGTKKLTEKTDYKISYSNNKKVGAAKVTITPCGNYEKASKFTVTFNIVPRKLNKDNVTIKYTSLMNIKKNKKDEVVAQAPKKVTLKYGTVTVPAREYEVKYYAPTGEEVQKLTEAGTYQMVIKTKEGSSFDTGDNGLSYDIVLTDKILMSALKISVPAQNWTGEELKPEVTVKYKNKNVAALDEKDLDAIFDIRYADNIHAGTASVTLTAKDDSNYYGSRTVTFKIKGTDIKKAFIDGFQSTIPYTGNSLTQNVKLLLKENERELTEDTDYTISYSGDTTNAGKATMTITGIGEFSGTVKKTFTIGKVNLKNAGEDVKVSFADPALTSMPQDKSGAEPAIQVLYKEKALVQDVDYKVSYSNNKAVGTNGKVTVKGIGNYTGDLKNVLSFEVTQKDINDSSIKIVAADLKYAANGKYKAKITVYDNGVKLSAKEYTVSKIEAENVTLNNEEEGKNPKCGMATVTVEGKKNYTGTKKVEIQIKETLISSAKVKVNGTYYYANGEPVCPSIDKLEVTIGSGKNKITLTPGTDYEIDVEGYSNHTKKGNATLTIRGLGDYGGTKTVKYKILPKWMRK